MGEISASLVRNREWVQQQFENCDDILNRQVFLEDGKKEGLLVYVEVAVSNLMLEEHVIGLSDVQPLNTYGRRRALFLRATGFCFWKEMTRSIKSPAKDIRGLGFPRQKVKRLCGDPEKDLLRVRN